VAVYQDYLSFDVAQFEPFQELAPNDADVLVNLGYLFGKLDDAVCDVKDLAYLLNLPVGNTGIGCPLGVFV